MKRRMFKIMGRIQYQKINNRIEYLNKMVNKILKY